MVRCQSPKGRQDIVLANITQPKRRPIDRLSAIWNLLCVHSRPKLAGPDIVRSTPVYDRTATSLEVRFVPNPDKVASFSQLFPGRPLPEGSRTAATMPY